MRHAAAAPITTRRNPRLVVLGVGAITAALIVVLVLRATGTSTSSLAGVLHPVGVVEPSSGAESTSTIGDGVISEHDGVVPSGVTPFNDSFAAVANLDPALLAAVRDAAADAADDGVTFFVNSGWRSPEYQLQLRREAVAEYGSLEEAGRWVATPETSAHVSGDAVDIGPADAATWLGEHGAAFGLCQTYRNEPWHFELRSDAVDHGCPRMFHDPTEDPRMHPG